MRFLDRVVEQLGLVLHAAALAAAAAVAGAAGRRLVRRLHLGRARPAARRAGIAFDAISGVSAGAVNAVLLASGLMEGGRDAAKARLEQFWKRMSRAAALMPSAALAGLSLG